MLPKIRLTMKQMSIRRNYILGINMVAASEGMSLGEKLGID